MSFKSQLDEDIMHIQNSYKDYDPYLNKPEYAFNYWILSKLYSIDEEVLQDNITEYRDDGVDCFVSFEDAKELFIIQNKYYKEGNRISRTEAQDLLIRPLHTLKTGNYSRSQELQKIYNKYKNDKDFRIHLILYISNDDKDQVIIDMYEKFQPDYSNVECYIDAKIYYLSDIQYYYFEDRHEEKKNYKCDFLTINDGTVLNINRENYNLPNLIEAKYILTPVSQIYSFLKQAKNNNYGLFDDNIREYLGNKGINAKIAKTLESKDDRRFFFYYNNGITIICEKVEKESSHNPTYTRKFITHNPKIVNGCQTVNTIYEVLNKYNQNDIETEFRDSFVMVKLLVLDTDNEKNKILYKDIVKYNNSQNAINERDFEANKSLYLNIQRDLEDKGFLLCVKQSDKYQFKSSKSFNTYRIKINKFNEMFRISLNKLDDILIPLEKFLQVILAFTEGGYSAFTKKNRVLKLDDTISLDIIKFITSSTLTFDELLFLYLLFLKAEIEKTQSEDKKTPIPYYVIGFLGKEFENSSSEKLKLGLNYIFSSSENINAIYEYYKIITKLYKVNYRTMKDIEYNQMIKMPIDENLLYQATELASEMLNQKVKNIVGDLKNIVRN